jgi:hypothetical protein
MDSVHNSASLIALEDEHLAGVAGGCAYGSALEALKGISIGAINIDIDVNTQVNIINFIGNVIKANGDVAIDLGQVAQAQL